MIVVLRVACILSLGFATPVPDVRAAETVSVRQDASGTGEAEKVLPEGVGISFEKQVVPFLRQYCVGCHGDHKKKGGLDLEALTRKDQAEVVRAVAVWQGVAERLAAREMPPEEQPQPIAGERAEVVQWIHDLETRAAAEEKPEPGRVTIRRLNRTEYNNTVRDLLGVDLDPARDFPSDDVGYGFDNIGDVLSLPPVLVERYLTAAERIAKRVIIGEVPPRRRRQVFQIERLAPTPAGSRVAGPALIVPVGGRVHLAHDFPVTGEYRLVVRAYGQPGNDRQSPRLAIRLDGVDLRTFVVATSQSSPGTYAVDATIVGGPHRLEVALADTKGGPGRKSGAVKGESEEGAGGARCMLGLDSLAVEGPRASTWRLPESHRRLVPRSPSKQHWREEAREFLATLATRAYRRPVTAAEVNRLAGFVETAVKGGQTFETGMQMALRAVLVSPHFLFRVELDDGGSAREAKVLPVGQWALASRLSYFLWSSMPDEELFGLAREGRLRDPGVLEAQVKRMLKDPRAEALVQNFASQWLQVRTLATLRRPNRQFPSFDDDLKAAMVRETELFFGEVMRRDLSVLTFLDANFTFLNERLARHYGISGVEGDEFRRVHVTDGVRGGVLTQASVLTVTSNPTRTSAVKRGRWVLEQLLGTPPPPPPPGVPELKEKDKRREGLTTMRQVLEQHRKDPACAVCHKKLDPLGFGLENFDAVGAWRTHEGTVPIDSSGVLPDGQKFNGVRELKAVLLSKDRLFRRSLASKLLTYALGRGTEDFDRPAIDRISEEMAKDGNSFSAMVLAIVRSDPFQKYRVVATAGDSEVSP